MSTDTGRLGSGTTATAGSGQGGVGPSVDRAADAAAGTASAAGGRLAGWASPAALLPRLPAAIAVAIVPPMAVAGLAQQLGAWTPVVGVGALAAGAVLGVLAARVVPAAPVSRRTGALLLLLAVGLGVWAGLTHGEHVVVRRDAGAYATYALSLDAYGGVPLDPQLEVFGLAATDPQVRVSAAANYQVSVLGEDGRSQLAVVPQFLVGAPALFSIGWWLGGWTGLFLVPVVLAAAAVAAFGALASHVLGPRSAVAATAALVVSQPLLLVARQTYSEPVSLLLLLAAGLLVALALDAPDAARARWLGLLGGALAAANLLVRLDGVRELVLLVPILAVLVGLRRPAGGAIAGGAVAVGLPAALATTWWSSPYVAQVEDSLEPLLLVGLVLVAASVAAVPTGRLLAGTWQRAPAPLAALARALPAVATAAVVVAGAYLVSRPLWLVERRESPGMVGREDFVEALQVAQGLPPDGTRTYAENSVQWLSWWVGWPLLAVVLVTAAALAWVGTARLLRGQVPGWVVPFAVGLAVTVLSLYRPAITPDHPWADRRFVTVVLPWVVLVGTAGLAWAVRRARRLGPASWAGAAGLAALALVLPAAVTTLPLATARTEVGQVAAVERVCQALGPDAAVVAVGFRARVEWAPVVRARCQVPLVGLVERGTGAGGGTAGLVADIGAAAEAARGNGRVPVVLAGDAATVAELGLQAEQVVDLDTTEPERVLLEPTAGTRPLPVEAWLARP